tara:strand:+ start:134 stop:1267 length:1134 start_codon:yes stop_codon:yes gene_type:complete
MTKKIIFLTGTRADFGKLKPLMLCLEKDLNFEVHIFVTGMHMLNKYGYTCEEVENTGFKNVYKYINQSLDDSMDQVLAKTIMGLSNFFREINPDLLIVHGDRVETLAGASVGALNNVLVCHVEGGEVSGTVDELIRHSVSKLSHIHLVANDKAKKRLLQLGEEENSIYVIGSPDIDIMNSNNLPKLNKVKEYYEIDFDKYSILAFHPVTTELIDLKNQIKVIVDTLIDTELNYIVIFPNNDNGTNIILNEYLRFNGYRNIKVYPSMRFEYFLTLLKNSEFIIGNSSSGIREAPYFAVPTINLGTRQKNRVLCDTVVNIDINFNIIKKSINNINNISRAPNNLFGKGKSAELFYKIIYENSFWNIKKQKYFIDRILDE